MQEEETMSPSRSAILHLQIPHALIRGRGALCAVEAQIGGRREALGMNEDVRPRSVGVETADEVGGTTEIGDHSSVRADAG